jgi:glutaredoxin 1|tara:strand:+ start:3482 stop:3724 length:243 start_codon:yes stop_codon:yes gene_type:complete
MIKADEVIIYGKEGCGYCTLSKTLCEQTGIDYSYKSLEKDFTIEELYDIVPFKTFPQIFYNGKSIGGYTELKAIVDNLVS